MSKLDKAKTIIDFLKSIIITLLVGLFGMISFVFLNINTLILAQVAIIVLAILLDIIVLVILTIKALEQIEKIEEL